MWNTLRCRGPVVSLNHRGGSKPLRRRRFEPVTVCRSASTIRPPSGSWFSPPTRRFANLKGRSPWHRPRFHERGPRARRERYRHRPPDRLAPVETPDRLRLVRRQILASGFSRPAHSGRRGTFLRRVRRFRRRAHECRPLPGRDVQRSRFGTREFFRDPPRPGTGTRPGDQADSVLARGTGARVRTGRRPVARRAGAAVLRPRAPAPHRHRADDSEGRQAHCVLTSRAGMAGAVSRRPVATK